MKTLATLVLAAALVGASQAAVTFATTKYDDNGAGFTPIFTTSGNSYTLTFGPGATLAPGEFFFLTYNTTFNSTSGPFNSASYAFSFTTTGSTTGLVEVDLNAAVFNPGFQGSTDRDLYFGGNANFSPSINVPFNTSLTNAEIQTSPYVINDTDGYVTLDSITVTPVPEPASMAALAIGGLGLLRRRRKA